MEYVGIIWILFWTIASLCLPFGVAVSLCCSKHRRLKEDSSESCGDRLLGYILHASLILMISPIIVILAGNEQIYRSISKSPVSASKIYEDINTFLKNTHMQISFVVTSYTNIAFQEIEKDLDATQELLGNPYQQQLISETGIEKMFVHLEDLEASTYIVASLVSDLIIQGTTGKIVSNLLEEQLRDIVQQLTIIVQQQCEKKDRILCYTLQIPAFDVDFSVYNMSVYEILSSF